MHTGFELSDLEGWGAYKVYAIYSFQKSIPV